MELPSYDNVEYFKILLIYSHNKRKEDFWNLLN